MRSFLRFLGHPTKHSFICKDIFYWWGASGVLMGHKIDSLSLTQYDWAKTL